jgi:hypothetical protein
VWSILIRATDRYGLALVVLALVAAACTSAPRVRAVARRPSPQGSPSERGVTRPLRAKVSFRATGEPARRLRQAERDLKAVGLWGRLSNHLYEVRVAVRPGRSDIPEDRHLADAYPSAVAAPGGYGSLCDIVFYPAAIAADLERWRRLHARGLLGPPPSTLQQYWGSILAHELGHCLGNGKGEAVAEHWEAIARERLRRHQSVT